MRKSSDFEFWVENLPEDHPTSGDSENTEVEFQILTHDEDHSQACSPPSNQHRIYPSPTSRLRAVANGRKERMEMIKDIPESSYELSLKDIVEGKHSNKRLVNETVLDERNSNNETEIKNSKKNTTAKRSQISRAQSMESGVFLLRMSLPISLSSKKKSKARKCTKVSAEPLSEGPVKQDNKDWWKTILSAVREKNIRRSLSDITGSKTSLAERKFMPRQLSLNSKKYKSSRQRGCLF